MYYYLDNLPKLMGSMIGLEPENPDGECPSFSSSSYAVTHNRTKHTDQSIFSGSNKQSKGVVVWSEPGLKSFETSVAQS